MTRIFRDGVRGWDGVNINAAATWPIRRPWREEGPEFTRVKSIETVFLFSFGGTLWSPVVWFSSWIGSSRLFFGPYKIM